MLPPNPAHAVVVHHTSPWAQPSPSHTPPSAQPSPSLTPPSAQLSPPILLLHLAGGILPSRALLWLMTGNTHILQPARLHCTGVHLHSSLTWLSRWRSSVTNPFAAVSVSRQRTFLVPSIWLVGYARLVSGGRHPSPENEWTFLCTLGTLCYNTCIHFFLTEYKKLCVMWQHLWWTIQLRTYRLCIRTGFYITVKSWGMYPLLKNWQEKFPFVLFYNSICWLSNVSFKTKCLAVILSAHSCCYPLVSPHTEHD